MGRMPPGYRCALIRLPRHGLRRGAFVHVLRKDKSVYDAARFRSCGLDEKTPYVIRNRHPAVPRDMMAQQPVPRSVGDPCFSGGAEVRASQPPQGHNCLRETALLTRGMRVALRNRHDLGVIACAMQ
ncbi:MAG: hypothetical protein ACPMAQ_14580 [Phycisphaerae bacterium]